MPQRPADELLGLHESRFSRASPRAASVGSSPSSSPPPPPLRHFRDSSGLVNSRSGGGGRVGKGREGPFCCWLCETPCEGAGWLSAPRLYVHSSAPADPKRNPTRWANGPRGAAMPMPMSMPMSVSVPVPMPVTRLTLCTRCSAACALPADESHENVMRRAGATRASAQRSELFVTALREYKLLLEVLAAEVREAHGDTPLAECPLRVRSMLLRQLVTTIESTLEVNALAERTSASAVLSETERLILDAELQWLEEQISRDKEQVAVGPSASSSLLLSSSSVLSPRTRATRRNTTHSSAVGAPCNECRVVPARRGDRSAVPVGGKMKSVAATQQRCKASATSKSIQTGETSIIEATQTTVVKSQLEDNILLQYFEGRLRDLPPFQLIRRPRGDAVRIAAHKNTNTNTKANAELIASKEANARRCEEAEAALRESHQRIAALEKLTDNLSETVLTHRLSATLAEDLGTMHALLHVTADVCAEFTLQKSLLFAEEMAEVVRQTQRHVYGVPKRFAVQSAAFLAMANRCGEPSEEAEREEKKKKKKTATDGAAEKSSLFPASLALKPLVCPSPNE